MLLDEDEGVEENKLHEKKPWKYFCFALSKHIHAIPASFKKENTRVASVLAV